MIERKKYLERLIAKKENGLVKVITGIRRCGKSYLLFNIYKDYLKSIGVEDECIICLALDDDENIKKEMEVSLQAGTLVGKLYDALLKQYNNPPTEKELNFIETSFCSISKT